MYYKLDEHKNVVPGTREDFIDAFDGSGRLERKVGQVYVGETMISTMFLSLDHRYDKSQGEPLVFETMVFGGPLDTEMRRYCTWDEAVAGHQETVARVMKAQGDYTVSETPPIPPAEPTSSSESGA